MLEFVNPSRNYLTLIIALIVAACLAVGLGFSFSAQYLDTAQRWFFIIFLALFPVFGLILSIWLVLRHFRKLAVGEKDDEIVWRIMSPEQQRRKLDTEVLELAGVMNIPANQLSDLRSAYIVAEDLALRHIEKDAQISLMRHVALNATEFDAVLINQEIIKCIEVSFVVTPNISQGKIASFLEKIEITKRKLDKIRPHTKLVLTLALVTQLDRAAEAKLRSTLGEKFSATPVDVDIRLFDFEELQRIFTTG